MSPDVLEEVRPRLLAWYDTNQRDLPWRTGDDTDPDPYHIWVSEVMLQQTQVETVKPYYLRWVERFPDLRSLAAAEQDEVLKMWEGLGYYARARNLHRAVREVVDRYGAEVPAEPALFRKLPGVGRYTAGAVASIAFGREEPVVDGNVRRVFARLLDEPAPREAQLWKIATQLVRGPRPGDLNQAVMELGATVCTPRSPGCDVCPVTRACAARAAGTQADRPARIPAREIPSKHHGVAVIEGPAGLLLRRRPEGGLLGGMWEFPSVARDGGESAKDAARRAARELTGVVTRELNRIGTIIHRFTHLTVEYEAFHGSVLDQEIKGSDIAWAPLCDLDDFAMPRAQQRIAQLMATPQLKLR